jgi:hypothetical protein
VRNGTFVHDEWGKEGGRWRKGGMGNDIERNRRDEGTERSLTEREPRSHQLTARPRGGKEKKKVRVFLCNRPILAITSISSLLLLALA